MHILGGIPGAVLGRLPQRVDGLESVNQRRAFFDLAGLYVGKECREQLPSALMRKPHVVEHHLERGNARGGDCCLPGGRGLIRRAPLPSGIFPMAAARHRLISFDCFSKIALQCIHIFRHAATPSDAGLGDCRWRGWHRQHHRRHCDCHSRAMTQLILKRASASRPSGQWNEEDYDVLANGEVVGRIFKVNAAPVGSP
jgi:hypothetical protein